MVILVHEQALLLLHLFVHEELQFSSPVVLVILAEGFFAEGHSHVVTVGRFQGESICAFFTLLGE